MILPNKYIETILKILGKKGKEWLNNIDSIIEKNAELYNLSEIKPVNNLTYNLVMTAISKEYGEVIVKIGLPDRETIQEITTLKYFNVNFACKCYASDFNDLFYVLEKLKPGTDLLKVKEKDKRINIFCELAQNLPVICTESVDLPTYRKTLDIAFDKARNNKDEYCKIIDLVEIADNIYSEIESLNLNKYILHGDLHHTNILLDNNTYKAIDPHGRIGEKILELGVFIKNELMIYGDSKKEIEETINVIAKKINENEIMIAKVTFIILVLSCCWNIEDNNQEYIDREIQIYRKILKLYNLT